MPEEVLVIATMMILVLPLVVWLLAQHQRRMAEILHNARARTETDDALRAEMQQMRAILAQQTIALDTLAQNLHQLSRSTEQEGDLSRRIQA